MVKLTKYKSHKIYACPICWFKLEKPEIGPAGKKTWCCYRHSGMTHETEKPIIFDSKIEYQVGRTLEGLNEKNEINNLWHHEVFVLLPEKQLQDIQRWSPQEYCFLHEHNLEKVKVPQPFKRYESDFSFNENGIKKVIEVKGLAWKKSTRKVKDVQGEKLNVSTKKPWPFFTREQPLSQFRMKAQLMKAFHKLDVKIWAGCWTFAFDEKWKLVEVIK